MAGKIKIIRRIRADLERSSAAAVIEIAEALSTQYPDLSPPERIKAAYQLLQEVAKRLRNGETVSFARPNPDGTYELAITAIVEGALVNKAQGASNPSMHRRITQG